jgi:hypothetical protein
MIIMGGATSSKGAGMCEKMKTRHCVAGDHTVFGSDADMMGRETGDGFVCNSCLSRRRDDEGDDDEY